MKHRPGYTLLEVLIAMAISLLLLAALYAAVGYQVRQAQAGRDLLDRATVARAILGRIRDDILAATSLGDPARFRLQQQQQSSPSGSGSGSGSGAGASGAASGSAASGAGASASGSGSGSGSSSTSPPGVVVNLPLGVMGDSSSLHLFISKLPSEVWPTTNGDLPPPTSDLRRISYWISSDGKPGLCRNEIKVITSQDALNIALPTGEPAQYMLSPEVHSIEFTYYDGTTWQESWDSTMLGPDNITPVGSPRAVAIKVGVRISEEKNKDGEHELKYYRHVVALASANGTTVLANGQVTQNGLSTTGQGTATSSTPTTGTTTGSTTSGSSSMTGK
jgi:prepilin-type N-terminal cleavage/methylation domain-containing protein